MAESLLECKTDNDVVKLRCSHFQNGDFSVLTDGYTVWLSEQKVGAMPAQKIGMPKRVFDSLIRNYIKPQKRKANG